MHPISIGPLALVGHSTGHAQSAQSGTPRGAGDASRFWSVPRRRTAPKPRSPFTMLQGGQVVSNRLAQWPCWP